METLAGAWVLIVWAVLVLAVAVVARRRGSGRPPRRQVALMVVALAVAAVAVGSLATTACFGNPDDKGRAGRFMDLPNPDPDPKYGDWSLLWPGTYYALPLLAALGVTLLLTVVALRRIAARPRAADPVAADEQARRRSAAVVLAGVAAAAALCGAGLVVASGTTPLGFPWNVLGMVVWVVVPAAAAVGAWSAAVLVTPDPVRRPDPVPTAR